MTRYTWGTSGRHERPQRLKNITLLVALLLWGGVADISSLAAAPKIFLSEEKIDFGSIPFNKKISHELTIFNRGGGNLNIRSIRTRCGCLSYVLSATTVPAGATASLNLRYSSRIAAGTESFKLYIASNSDERSQLVLPMSAFVYRPVVLMPKVFALQGALPGRKHAIPFRVETFDKKPLILSATAISSPHITIAWDKIKSASAWVHSGTATYTPPSNAPFNKMIMEKACFATGRKDQPKLEMLFAGYVAGIVEAKPRRITMDGTKQSETFNREVVFACQSPYVFSASGEVKVNINTPYLVAQQIHASSREIKYRVSMKPGTSKRQFNSRLRLETGITEHPTCDVRIKVVNPTRRRTPGRGD
jgi:Protein of unknown function (DUF1573)